MVVVRNQWQLLQHFRPCGPTGRLVCKANMNANEFAVALAAGAFAGLAFGTWRQRGLCTTSKGLPPPVPPDVRDVCACVVSVWQSVFWLYQSVFLSFFHLSESLCICCVSVCFVHIMQCLRFSGWY